MQTLNPRSLGLICLLGAASVQQATAQYDWSAYSAQMISPVNGTPIVSSTVTFQWTAGSYVQDYYLALGSSPGSTDAGSFHGTATHFTGLGIPLNGQPLYATLYSAIGGAWQRGFVYTYPASPGPGPGQYPRANYRARQRLNLGCHRNLSMGCRRGALEYFIYIGSTLGQNDLVGQTQGLNRSCMLRVSPRTAGSFTFGSGHASPIVGPRAIIRTRKARTDKTRAPSASRVSCSPPTATSSSQ